MRSGAGRKYGCTYNTSPNWDSRRTNHQTEVFRAVSTEYLNNNDHCTCAPFSFRLHYCPYHSIVVTFQSSLSFHNSSILFTLQLFRLLIYYQISIVGLRRPFLNSHLLSTFESRTLAIFSLNVFIMSSSDDDAPLAGRKAHNSTTNGKHMLALPFYLNSWLTKSGCGFMFSSLYSLRHGLEEPLRFPFTMISVSHRLRLYFGC